MSFGDLTLRRKLIAIGVAATATALLLTSAVFLITTYLSVQRYLLDDIAAQASIIADNSTAALAFGDQAAVGETLNALRAKPSIDIACLYDAGDQLFTFFSASRQACPTIPPSAGQQIMTNAVTLTRPIEVGGRKVGAIYIRGNMNELVARMRIEGGVALLGFVIGLAAAVLIASRLERVTLAPLRSLAETAERISHGNDYSLRAPKQTDDEIGALVDAFNGMVEQTERRTHQLSAANNELSRASRLKDEFLAALSHELRTPLNAILGWMQILLKTPVGPEQRKRALDSVDRNARAQARLIEDLLDISRIISGKLHFKSEIVEIVGVVLAAIDSIRPAAAVKRVEVTTQLEPPPKVVMGDPDRLQQAVWNVLSNAVKFSAPGGRIDVELKETSQATILITVRDFGDGIDAAFLPYVFDRFRQADGSLTRQHGGLGLGLAIAREIVELHGGRIQAESDGPGAGALFSVSLPALESIHGKDAGPRASQPAVDLRGVNVLVVDDDQDARELARLGLSAAGAEVATASAAEQALQTVAAGRFDVIVCDIAMPGCDGYELLDRIREQESERGRFTPAIAVTAYASDGSRQKAETAGYQSFLSKPYEFNDLAAAVARVRHERAPSAPQGSNTR